MLIFSNGGLLISIFPSKSLTSLNKVNTEQDQKWEFVFAERLINMLIIYLKCLLSKYEGI